MNFKVRRPACFPTASAKLPTLKKLPGEKRMPIPQIVKLITVIADGKNVPCPLGAECDPQ
jgi:hypothetical protein